MRSILDWLDRVLALGGPVARVLIVAVLLGGIGLLVLLLTSCSSGPQLPVVTTPINIACTWNAQDGGTIEDCDCLVDRSSAASASETTGNRARDIRVDPRTSVSATGGAP